MEPEKIWLMIAGIALLSLSAGLYVGVIILAIITNV